MEEEEEVIEVVEVVEEEVVEEEVEEKEVEVAAGSPGWTKPWLEPGSAQCP